jgi:diguanylate cyclase (GGDEF)-like protein
MEVLRSFAESRIVAGRNESSLIYDDSCQLRDRMSEPSITGIRRRYMWSTAIVAFAGQMPFVIFLFQFPKSSIRLVPFVAISALFLAMEKKAIRVAAGAHHMNFSPSEIPMLAAALFLDPVAHLAARVIGSGIGTFWRVRSTPDTPTIATCASNMATAGFEAAIFGVALHFLNWSNTLTGWAPLSPALAGLGANLGFHLVNQVCRRYTGDRASYRFRILSGLVTSFFTMCAAVMFAMALSRHDLLPVLLAVFVIAIAFPFRQMLRLLAQGEGYRALDEFYRYLQNTTSAEVDGALKLAGETAKSNTVELVILEREGLDHNLDSALVIGVGSRTTTTVEALPKRWYQSLQTRQMVVRSDRSEMSDAELPTTRTEIICPLTVDGTAVGLLVCSDQLDSAKTIKADDTAMVERLGQHLSLWFEKDRLISELRQGMLDRTVEALHDPLTGLLNRRGFDEAWTTASGNGLDRAAVLMVDLDYFKGVNSHKGHQGGDEVLKQVAARLLETVPERSFVARFGGDEFAICIPDLRAADASAGAYEFGLRVRAVLAKPHDLDGEELSVGGSVGISIFPDHGVVLPDLLSRADASLYAAKEDPSIGVASQSLMNIEDAEFFDSFKLESAILDGSIQPWFQPIIDMRTYQVAGFEALVRWHDGPNVVSPNAFIPLAEKSGHIHALTIAVIKSALPNIVRWRTIASSPLHVSINFSPLSLSNPDIINTLTSLLRHYGLAASAVHVEVTESRVLKDPERATVYLQNLQTLGMKISLDDFGTGHSSFEWLMHLGADELKVDRIFTKDIAHERAQGIVKVQRMLASTFNMSIVAEGIETPEQWNQLRALDIDYGQGFLLGRPMPASEVDRWLREEEPFLRNTIALAASLRDGDSAAIAESSD